MPTKRDIEIVLMAFKKHGGNGEEFLNALIELADAEKQNDQDDPREEQKYSGVFFADSLAPVRHKPWQKHHGREPQQGDDLDDVVPGWLMVAPGVGVPFHRLAQKDFVAIGEQVGVAGSGDVQEKRYEPQCDGCKESDRTQRPAHRSTIRILSPAAPDDDKPGQKNQ